MGVVRPAVKARWCDRIGHRWTKPETTGINWRNRGRVILERHCLRCGVTEAHWSEPGIAGNETNRGNPFNGRRAS